MDAGLLTTRLPPGADALRTAIWLLDRGLWPVPVSPTNDTRHSSPGKSPIGKAWGMRRPTVEQLRATYRWHRGAGIGLLLGPRGKVVDLEVDDESKAAPVLARIFPAGVPETLGWRSARGKHHLFLWHDRIREHPLPAVVDLGDGAVELRLGGHGKRIAAVCPPSIAADGKAREWNGVWKIAPFPEELFAELARAAEVRNERRRRAPVICAPPPDIPDRYGAAALAREIEIVRDAAAGTRNRTLNRAAYSLGQLVASGLLARDLVEDALRSAAEAAGLEEREILPTLKSGLEAGLRSPRRPARRDERPED